MSDPHKKIGINILFKTKNVLILHSKNWNKHIRDVAQSG